MQRFLDIIFSLVALVILSPLLIPITIILSLTGEGEVFYVQRRVGLGGKPFGVYKFATMVKNSSSMGTGYLTTKNDPRVLPFGRVLRKTKLNEIPQILNVLKGDMSCVGPRPQVQKHFDYYPVYVRTELNKVRPGLTGIGSIFFRDEEGILEKNGQMSYEECYSKIIAPYKGDLEIWYIKNNSLYLYFLLIMLTIWVVVFPNSKTHLKILRNLPTPPGELAL
ncbi:MAG TPA: sugar transferase [Cyclobacteriaceae bacterium]|nr:sugar transferase [Cyclobacteriaceae bacterium]